MTKTKAKLRTNTHKECIEGFIDRSWRELFPLGNKETIRLKHQCEAKRAFSRKSGVPSDSLEFVWEK
jgi:hypothetical protein